MRRFNVDKALAKLKLTNSWRLLHYSLWAISYNVSCAFHMFVAIFTGGVPEHHCQIPDNFTLEEAVPYDENGKPSQCEIYVNFSSATNETTVCPSGWEYDPDMGSTIVTQWDLVCDKNFYAELTQSLFVTGVLLGAIIFPQIADKYGRKPVQFACQWGMIVVGTLVAVMPNYESMTVMKIIDGALREGAGLIGMLLTCELWQSKIRPIPGIAIQLFWIGAWILLALLAYLIRNWIQLQLTISLISLYTIPLWWILPESLYWLVANGRGEEAAAHLKTAAAWEGNPDVCDEILGEAPRKVVARASMARRGSLAQRVRSLSVKPQEFVIEDMAPNYTLLDIRRSNKLILYTVLMCSLWFVNALVYHGLSMMSSSLAGDRYFNFFLSGVVEIPAYILCIFVLQKFGRRLPLCLHHVLTGVVLLIATFIPRQTASGHDLTWLLTTLALIGKYGISFTFGEICLYTQEIYPTNLRGAGLGVAAFFGRTGNIIAPFSTFIVRIIPWLPGLVFGVLSIVIGLLVLLLPETMGRALPLTIEEVDGWTIIPGKERTSTEDGTAETPLA